MPRILLIDDDDAFRVMLRITLTLLEHEVQEARNGNEALLMFDEAPYDVVMTDIIMPKKDGLELIGELRKKAPGMRIIAMSGGGRVSGTDYLKMAKSLGAHGILNKPFSKSEVEDMLGRVALLPV